MSHRIPGNKVSLILAVISALTVSYGLYIVHFVRVHNLPEQLQKAGAGQFLTNLSAHLTVHYYFLSIVAHLTKNETLYHFKNNYFLTVVLSLEFIVTIVYWSLKLFFVHLILMKNTVPFAVDFCLHLAPFATLLIDYLLFLPQFQISYAAAIGLCGVLASAYWAWLDFLIDPALGQLYPYPFLNVETKKRVGIFVFIASLAFVGFVVIRKVYDVVVPEKVKQDVSNAEENVKQTVKETAKEKVA